MGFLERKAIERARRRLAPLMAPDEENLDFDIATSDLNPRIRVDLIATTRALYLFDSYSRQTTRLPYESIADVFWGGDAIGWKGRLILKTPTGGGFILTMKRGYRNVGEIVECKVADQTLSERHVLFEGSQGATFRYRRFGEGQPPGWQVVPDQGVELDHPPAEAWAGETMRKLKIEADAAVPPFQPGDPFVRHVGVDRRRQGGNVPP